MKNITSSLPEKACIWIPLRLRKNSGKKMGCSWHCAFPEMRPGQGVIVALWVYVGISSLAAGL